VDPWAETEELDGVEIWREPETVRTSAVMVFLAFVVFSLLSTAIGISASGALVLWAFTLLVMVCVWRWYLVPYVALTGERLEVQGAFAHRSVDYRSIREATPGILGLRIETTTHGAFTAWAVQKSKFAEWAKKRTTADELAAQILDRAELAA
jgi:uncharacterized membrane protein